MAAIVGDRNRLYKHIQRARIVLLSADRPAVLEGVRQTGASRPARWRWQQRFAQEGADGLLRDKTRKPGKKPLPAATVAKIPFIWTKPADAILAKLSRLPVSSERVSALAKPRKLS